MCYHLFMKINEFIEKYTYRVQWSEEDGVHISKCLEFPSLMAHGDTIEIALKEIKDVVKETLVWMEEENEKIPEPFGMKKYKGKLTLRVPEDVHRQLAISSAEQGVSVNQYILSRIQAS